MVVRSLKLEAARLYQQGLAENLRFDHRRQTVTLYDWRLVEDDAAGCGWPFEQDILGPEVRIRKLLTVDSPAAEQVWLLIYHGVEKLWESEPHEAPLAADVNGHKIQVTLKQKWNAVEIDPAILVEGDNEIVLSAAGGSLPPVMPIAGRQSILANEPQRKGRPQKSFKSTDGGRSWSPGLGQGGSAAGEYMVRLQLRQFVCCGTYVSPVVDLADPDGKEQIKSPAEVSGLLCAVDHEAPEGTSLMCLVRTGPRPVFDAAAWSQWQPIAAGQPQQARGRYCQVQLLLATTDPLTTPAVKSLTIEAEVQLADPSTTARLSVREFRNHPLIRSAIPFQYEPLDHPSLKELRQTYRLDAVVEGADSQFQQIVRLNHWVAEQWKWHPPDPYPEWNALEILEKLPGGESRGGFCGQYAIVLAQCCLAMGLQARFVFGSLPGVLYGHEVTEVWSDDYGKWILMDPNMDRYYLDPQTREPMNALEIHRSILEHFFKTNSIGDEAHNIAAVDEDAFQKFLDHGPVAVHGGTVAGPDWFDPRRAHLMWGHPGMMPRNNFFSKPRPLPRAHGLGLPWSWNGYRLWYDRQTPRRRHFAAHTDRECDFYWNLNQVDFTLEATGQPAVLTVTAETTTPDLDALLVSVGGGLWAPSAMSFAWPLSRGDNTLRMKTRNTLGVEGAMSVVGVNYTGK